jgi:hypothetical protein
MAKHHDPDNQTKDPAEENVRLMLAHFHQTEQARLERAKDRLRKELLPALRKTYRVASIEAAYSGYGDSGAIDGVQIRDAAGERVDRTLLPDELVEALEACVYAFLPSGFEINDGGQGTVLIDARTEKVTLKHQENFTETRDSTREFDL